MGRSRIGEQNRTHQIQDQIERTVTIESPKLRQRKGNQNQDCARHFEHEVDHSDHSQDTEVHILPTTGYLMIWIP